MLGQRWSKAERYSGWRIGIPKVLQLPLLELFKVCKISSSHSGGSNRKTSWTSFNSASVALNASDRAAG